LLAVPDLIGKTFLDIGCGSGLFSLAARRLKARVRSFDFNPRSVACAETLKERFFPGDPDWSVGQGSVLDESFMASLGTFDVVYAWGVLHHTGDMARALELAGRRVALGGRLAVAIYNHQGGATRRWTWVKKTYNNSSWPVKGALLLSSLVATWGVTVAKDLLSGNPFRSWRDYHGRERGMSPWHNLVD
jgi:2-polyprenyl-6-hydroxyphenyl methylase/3-demethylubiquinone-9 3-methyltransferase